MLVNLATGKKDQKVSKFFVNLLMGVHCEERMCTIVVICLLWVGGNLLAVAPGSKGVLTV